MESTEQIRRNRIVLLSIIGLPVTMILAATWLWFFVVQGDLDLVGALGTANRGTLVQPPRQLDDVGLFEQNGYEFKYADMEPKWTMLVPASGRACDQACEHRLYTTRQIHIAMGKEFNRLRRIYLNESAVADTGWTAPRLSDDRPLPQSFGAYLEAEHRGLKALVLEQGASAELLAEYLSQPDTWYLVDPAGWIMMSYNDQVPYKDVISDLKFLLKNSSE